MKPEVTDLAALKELILWARKERVRISQVSIGGIALAMEDLGMPAGPRRAASAGPPDATGSPDPYVRYGGSLLEDALSRAGVDGTIGNTEDNTTYEDEDE